MPKRSACVVTIRSDGAMLAVSRPRPPIRYGFPGGQVESWETPRVAAERELYEETGMAPSGMLIKICDLKHGRKVISFFYASEVHGRLRSSHEGEARWVDPRVLYCSGAAFPEDARTVLKRMSYRMLPCSP